MKSLSDRELLREHLERRSEAAFAEFVSRHVDLVYATALRIVRDPHSAQDVTQGVFLAAAQNARGMMEHPVVAGWLHRTTQNLAANVVRAEVRRRKREQEATVMNEPRAGSDPWREVEPHIDEALAALKEEDRDVVLLRFFQGKSAREMAAMIGASEEAAQKRLTRAVEKIRKFLEARRVTIGTAALGLALSTRSIEAAPLGLAEAISKTVTEMLLTYTPAAAVAEGIIMTSTQKAIVAISVAVAVGTGVYEVQQTSRRQSAAGESARVIGDLKTQLRALQQDHDDARAEIQGLRNETGRLSRAAGEVHRLRAESTQMRAAAVKPRATEQDALIAWLQKTDAFKQAQYRLPEKSIPELALLTEEDWLQMAKETHTPLDAQQPDDAEVNRKLLKIAREKAKMKFGFLLSRALDRYREANADQLPGDIRLLRPFFEDREAHLGGSAELVNDAMLERYQILQSGAFEAVPAEKSVILAEISPADAALDTRLVIGKHWLQTAGEGDAFHWRPSSQLLHDGVEGQAP